MTRAGSVLAVMAHPDDPELWAGGTLALHARTAPVIAAVQAHDPVRNAEALAGVRPWAPRSCSPRPSTRPPSRT